MKERQSLLFLRAHVKKKQWFGAPSAGLSKIISWPTWEDEKKIRMILPSSKTLPTYKFYSRLAASVCAVCENGFFPTINSDTEVELDHYHF